MHDDHADVPEVPELPTAKKKGRWRKILRDVVLVGTVLTIVVGLGKLIAPAFFANKADSVRPPENVGSKADEGTLTGHYQTRSIKLHKGDVADIYAVKGSIKITYSDWVTKETQGLLANLPEKHAVKIRLEQHGLGGLKPFYGGEFFGGKQTICTDADKDEFVVPERKTVTEADYSRDRSIYFSYLGKDLGGEGIWNGKEFRFFRLNVEYINPHSKEVTLNVFLFQEN